MKFRFTAHALEQMERRGLDRVLVERMIENPEQVREQRLGREARQGRVNFPGGEYLLRAIIDRRTEPPAVVMVYRTRHIAKYWRQE
ncbi:MAG: DUF4258 domain-containing protein [Proteobacteria bacterium]|nr:DUF4258 domain-containing protein [Pseudomonadota bacterium]